MSAFIPEFKSITIFKPLIKSKTLINSSKFLLALSALVNTITAMIAYTNTHRPRKAETKRSVVAASRWFLNCFSRNWNLTGCAVCFWNNLAVSIVLRFCGVCSWTSIMFLLQFCRTWFWILITLFVTLQLFEGWCWLIWCWLIWCCWCRYLFVSSNKLMKKHYIPLHQPGGWAETLLCYMQQGQNLILSSYEDNCHRWGLQIQSIQISFIGFDKTVNEHGIGDRNKCNQHACPYTGYAWPRWFDFDMC